MAYENLGLSILYKIRSGGLDIKAIKGVSISRKKELFGDFLYAKMAFNPI